MILMVPSNSGYPMIESHLMWAGKGCLRTLQPSPGSELPLLLSWEPLPLPSAECLRVVPAHMQHWVVQSVCDAGAGTRRLQIAVIFISLINHQKKKKKKDRIEQGGEPAQRNQRCYFPLALGKNSPPCLIHTHLSPKSLLNWQPPRSGLGKEVTLD